MKKVIFLPGFTGGKRDMWLTKKMLKNFEVLYFNYDTGLNKKIEDIAKKLDYFVKKNVKGEKASIVGLSAGGVIATHYLKFINNKKIDKLVTICSPLKGTWLTHLFSAKRKGLQEISLNSNFLEKLNSKKLNVKSMSIYSYLDYLVPGNSGKTANSLHTLFFLHPIIQYNPYIINKVKKFLEK